MRQPRVQKVLQPVRERLEKGEYLKAMEVLGEIVESEKATRGKNPKRIRVFSEEAEAIVLEALRNWCGDRGSRLSNLYFSIVEASHDSEK